MFISHDERQDGLQHQRKESVETKDEGITVVVYTQSQLGAVVQGCVVCVDVGDKPDMTSDTGELTHRNTHLVHNIIVKATLQ